MRAIIEDIGDSERFAGEWRRLYAQSDARFFLSPFWIETLIAESGGPTRWRSLKIFDDLRGVYAMALVSRPAALPFPALRSVRINETGSEALDRIYIEYNDLLVAQNAPEGARPAAVAAIIDSCGGADQFVFRNVRAPMATAVASVGADINADVEVVNTLPTFQIEFGNPPFPRIEESFSASLRAKIWRSIRRYEERGPVRMTRLTGEADRAVAWTELMRLHAETWARRGKRGVFQERRFRSFHERMAERFPAQVDFVRLTAGDETIGVLYNLIHDGRAYNYQSGFRYEADNQLVPGFVAHALAAQQYQDDGFRTYDLMAGDADYKRRLGVEGEALATVLLTRRNFRSRFRSTLKSFRRH